MLVRGIFSGYADEIIISNPNEKISSKKSVIVAAGWKPGFSTDYDAVLLAKNLKIREVINMSNVNYVYDKDPKKYKDAKKIEKTAWNDFRKLIGSKWNYADLHTINNIAIAVLQTTLKREYADKVFASFAEARTDG